MANDKRVSAFITKWEETEVRQLRKLTIERLPKKYKVNMPIPKPLLRQNVLVHNPIPYTLYPISRTISEHQNFAQVFINKPHEHPSYFNLFILSYNQIVK